MEITEDHWCPVTPSKWYGSPSVSLVTREQRHDILAFLLELNDRFLVHIVNRQEKA
jgi:hypothetical protein